MTQPTKFENEQRRAMREANEAAFIRQELEARKQELLRELREINEQLAKL